MDIMNQTKNRPETTLFMLASLDGKISTGDTDILDTDKDFRVIKGISEGLKQYIEESGVKKLLERTKELFLITTNERHPAFGFKDNPKLKIIYYPGKVDFVDLFSKFKEVYKIDRITIQSGGTLNAILLRDKLIDHVSVVIAPALIGGKDTSTLIDGESLHTPEELVNIKALKLTNCAVLTDSYLHLQYDVINETKYE